MGKKIIKLNNGMKILLDKRKDALSAYATLSVNVGAFYPESQKVGLAHVLEHNICSGVGEEVLNRIGTTLEAFTYDFNTIYSVRTFNQYIHTCIDVLFDTVFNAKFTKKFFTSEKKVIKEEYKKQRANIMAQNAFRAAESYYSETFISKSGYGIGNAKQIDAISFEDVVQFYEDYYGLNNTTIVVVGNFNESLVLKQIKKLCKKYAKTANVGVKMIENDIKFNNSQKINVISYGDKNTCCVEIVFAAANEKNDKFYLYKCVSYMLCGMFSSSVVRDRLRNKLGIIYECDADVDGAIPYKDCGTLSIRYYVAKQNVVLSVLEAFNAVLSLLKEKNQTVLDIAKTCLINDLKIKCENLFAFTRMQVSSLALNDSCFDIKKVDKQIQNINYEDVCKAINDMLSKKIVVSILGAKIDSKKLNKKLQDII